MKTENLDLGSESSNELEDTVTAELTYPDNGDNFPILVHPGSEPTMQRIRDTLFQCSRFRVAHQKVRVIETAAAKVLHMTGAERSSLGTYAKALKERATELTALAI